MQEGKSGKDGEEGAARKKARKQARKAQLAAAGAGGTEELTAAQLAVNEQMRKALEEDQYSALGSIVDTESEDESTQYRGRGGRLDRSTILSAMRKRLWMERMSGNGSALVSSQDDDESENVEVASRASRPGRKKKRKKGRRSKEEEAALAAGAESDNEIDRAEDAASEVMSNDEPTDAGVERDESSIFGATTGSSNATWVECDKCKKVSIQCRIVHEH